MGRVVVQSYGNGMSKSARELAKYLGVKRVKVTGSRFVGKNGDVIVNWGKPRNIIARARYLNSIDAVNRASNKLIAFETMGEAEVSIPRWQTDATEIEWSGKTYARYDLHGHSGKGITVYEDTIPNDAPLYVEAIEKKAEYRAIVVGGHVVDVKQKKKKRDFEGERDENVWNCDNGYIFARNSISFPDSLNELAVRANDALGLVYGAVDIVENEDGELYVLEINTAFGLEGQTISLVGEAIATYIEEL